MATGILSTCRRSAGFTQESVADIICVSTSTLKRWERSDKCPPTDLKRLLDLYEIDIETRREIMLDMYGGGDFESVSNTLLASVMLERVHRKLEEISSCYILHSMGQADTGFHNSVAYIQGWARSLKGDRKMIIAVASQAEKAAKFILQADAN